MQIEVTQNAVQVLIKLFYTNSIEYGKFKHYHFIRSLVIKLRNF